MTSQGAGSMDVLKKSAALLLSLAHAPQAAPAHVDTHTYTHTHTHTHTPPTQCHRCPKAYDQGEPHKSKKAGDHLSSGLLTT